ncbi:TPA: hypothetical protein ACSP2X_000206 [Aeromonas veronii]
MGVDKVGHRAAMPGVEYFLCCMMAQAGDITGQLAIARRKYTEKSTNFWCARVAKWACQQEDIFT